jgi:uncharacterized protein (DUF169 family)
MDSVIVEALGLEYSPVAILWSDEKPPDAAQYEKGRWGCVMASLAAAAEKGKTTVFDRDTYGCPGAGVGLGFGNCYRQFVGGVDGFCRFLSTGNEGTAAAETAKQYMRGEQLDHFLHGERYRRTPQDVRKFVDTLPMMQVPTRYVVFKPLSQVTESEQPVVIVFLVNPDQMSALVVLANYTSDDSQSAIIPHAAGCQSIGIFTYREAQSERPRAVVGLVDPSARRTLRRLGSDLLTVSVPLPLFHRMEADVPGSFLERGTWLALKAGEETR